MYTYAYTNTTPISRRKSYEVIRLASLNLTRVQFRYSTEKSMSLIDLVVSWCHWLNILHFVTFAAPSGQGVLWARH